ILMTAFGDTFTEIESVRRGAIGYLNQPFEADEITGLVDRILSLTREYNTMEAFRVTQTIMDEYCARILLGTFDHPVSAIELGRRFGIPIAACYRRIKELEVMGLVYRERAEPSRNGRGLQLYRSRLRSVRI